MRWPAPAAAVLLGLGLSACFNPCLQDVYLHSIVGLDSIRSCTAITGSLVIEGTSIQTVELPNLQTVTGSIKVSQNPSLMFLRLNALQTVAPAVLDHSDYAGVTVAISDNPMLEEVTLAGLLAVGSSDGVNQISGHLLVDGLAVEKLEVPALANVYGQLELTHTHLTTLDLSALKRADGLVIGNNPFLLQVDGSNVATVREGGLFISGNFALGTVDLSKLVSVGVASAGGLSISNNAHLSTVNLTMLSSVALDFDVLNNPALPTLSLPGAFARLQVLRVKENAGMTGVFVPSTVQIDLLEIINNSALNDLGFAALAQLGSLDVRFNPNLANCEVKTVVDQVVARNGITGTVVYNNNFPDMCGL